MDTLIQKKICLLGDFAVGKTSLVRRFVYDRFDERYLSTIGVKIYRKEIFPAPDIRLNLLVWDLAGSEEFSGVQSSYLLGAVGALLVCDLTRPNTLHSLPTYQERLQRVSPGAHVVLLANKVDLVEEREISDDDLARMGEALRAPVFLTSAKTGQCVQESFLKMASLLMA